MNDLNQRISKIEVLLQKIDFLVSNVKESHNEATADAEFRLIQSYISELHEISKNLTETKDTAQDSIAHAVKAPTIEKIQQPMAVDNTAVVKPTVIEANEEPKEIEEPKASKELDVPPMDQSNGTEDPPSLNEALKQEEKDLAETVVTSKINNLKTAIDINQKFTYINELFNGDVDSFSQALDRLNSFNELSEANQYLNEELKSKYEWNEEASLSSLQEFVTRRYS